MICLLLWNSCNLLWILCNCKTKQNQHFIFNNFIWKQYPYFFIYKCFSYKKISATKCPYRDSRFSKVFLFHHFQFKTNVVLPSLHYFLLPLTMQYNEYVSFGCLSNLAHASSPISSVIVTCLLMTSISFDTIWNASNCWRIRTKQVL